MYYKTIKAADQLPEESGRFFCLGKTGSVYKQCVYYAATKCFVGLSGITDPDVIEWLSPCDDEIQQLQERVKQLESSLTAIDRIRAEDADSAIGEQIRSNNKIKELEAEVERLKGVVKESEDDYRQRMIDYWNDK